MDDRIQHCEYVSSPQVHLSVEQNANQRPSRHVDKNWQIDFKIYMKVLMILNSQNKSKQSRMSQSTWFQVLLCKDINQEM